MLLELLLCCSPMAPVPAPVVEADAIAAPAPQGRGRRPNSPPSGGTPEPTTLLLLAGGALGYGALRLARRKQATAAPTDEKV